jgi:hypothetical protein
VLRRCNVRLRGGDIGSASPTRSRAVTARRAGDGISQLRPRRISGFEFQATTPGAGCSITSAATVSTTGATGCFTFRATFFTGAGLGLAFAVVGFVAFAAFDGLRALPRAVAAFLCCAFDCFLRLAMIDPLGLIRAPQRCPLIKSWQPIKRVITDRNLSAP